MKELKLTVRIDKPAGEVFEFTTNPDNTPKWIDSIVREETDTSPVKIGTIYRNWNAAEEMNEYVVTQYESPKIFQLDATHQDYKVRYTYTPISNTETELEYYEWSESGQLHSPFMQEILDKLKEVMEETVA
ncbi:MAG: hypothetical protein JWO84_681 [Parcubacteria group bacterium]|nr:hypothetical protein [Parcubacteria group bacterium]